MTTRHPGDRDTWDRTPSGGGPVRSVPPAGHPDIPRRQLVTLAAYVEFGSHKAAARRLGISESTSRQRVSEVIRALGVANATQAAWVLRGELEAERRERVGAARTRG